MNVTVISDKENNFLSEGYFENDFKNLFMEMGLHTTVIQVGREDAAPCMGCFGCWIKTPGECVIKDTVELINRSIAGSELVIFITPIVFGQYSRNIKNVVDRGLGRKLPFFEKVGGRTVHPARYKNNPVQYVIGCAAENEKNEIDLFIETHEKYRIDVNGVFVCDSEEKITSLLQGLLKEAVK